jgi:hypothetical protein
VPLPVEGEVERIALWVQTLTGLRLEKDDRLQVLGNKNWEEGRRRLEQLGGPPLP